jgi:hypothetical protein
MSIEVAEIMKKAPKEKLLTIDIIHLILSILDS